MNALRGITTGDLWHGRLSLRQRIREPFPLAMMFGAYTTKYKGYIAHSMLRGRGTPWKLKTAHMMSLIQIMKTDSE